MPTSIAEIQTSELSQLLSSAGEAVGPVVMRGCAMDLPVVKAGTGGTEDVIRYLARLAVPMPVGVLRAPADVHGKFGYGANFRTFNFSREATDLRDFLAELARADPDDTAAIAIQGVPVDQAVPGFLQENALPQAPPGGEYRLWLGSRAEVAIHSDPAPNLAFVACGRRRFTLFPPEAIGDLYLGPFDPTPGGTQISLADPLQPDFARFPRFAEALACSESALLEPGDAIFIPFGWYHHVTALDPVNLLVNYWWPISPPGPSPWEALLHALMTVRPLPAAERRVWRAKFLHFAFEDNGDPAAHLPDDSKGVLAPATPRTIEGMRQALVRALTGRTW